MKSNFFGFLKPFISRGIAASAILGAGLGLCSCEKKSGTKASAAVTPANADDRPVVTVYIWDKYLSEGLMAEFTKRTGIEVQPKFYDSTDEMVEGLKSDPGKYDIFLCEDGWIETLAGKRLMRKLDHSQLKNLKNIDEKYQNPAFDPQQEYTVPYLWGTTLIAYRKDKIANPRHSWSILQDPELMGKVSMLDARSECYDVILRTLNIDLKNAQAKQLDQASEIMLGMVRDRGLMFADDNETKDLLLRGDAWVTMMYSGDAALIAKENKDVPIGYFIPDEGGIIWTDSFCISRDSSRVANAYKFLDFMLEAKSAAKSSNDLHYASPNKAAAPFLSQELLSDAALYPQPEILAKCQYFKLSDIESKRMINFGWRRVQEAWQERSGQVSNKVPDEADPATSGAPAPALQ
jgi:spermidine/putrescine transport system substrate-binding protein